MPDDPLINKYLDTKFMDIELVKRQTERPLELITDKNAITEFKYGYSLRRLY